MIQEFDQTARHRPEAIFYRFREAADISAAPKGALEEISYRQARLEAAALMRQLQREGNAESSIVACDMDNCPAFITLILACAYGSFTLVTLNHRLTEDEKLERLLDISLVNDLRPCTALTETEVLAKIAAGLKAESESTLLHRAERAAALSLREQRAVVMFTSGTTGKAKAAKLSGDNICGSAAAFNVSLATGVDVCWQATLPLYHIGGFQVVIRSILNDTPFLLYRRFVAREVLADAQRFHVTHISVVDKTLRDLLAEEAAAETLRGYRCIDRNV